MNVKHKESILWFTVYTVIHFEKLDLHVRRAYINVGRLFIVGTNVFLEHVLHWRMYFLSCRVICFEVFLRTEVHAFLHQLCASAEF